MVIRDAAVVSLAAALVALAVNLFHPEKIPLVAEEEYEILVPCPEPGGEVTAVEPGDPMLIAPDTFIVDARPATDFSKWRFRNAANVTYDYLDPTPGSVIQGLAKAIAKSRAKRVLVYGDGDLPDTGEQLGKEISANGIKNVYFIKGGYKALISRPVRGGNE
jgi:predicted sulfurtransferase